MKNPLCEIAVEEAVRLGKKGVGNRSDRRLPSAPWGRPEQTAIPPLASGLPDRAILGWNPLIDLSSLAIAKAAPAVVIRTAQASDSRQAGDSIFPTNNQKKPAQLLLRWKRLRASGGTFWPRL